MEDSILEASMKFLLNKCEVAYINLRGGQKVHEVFENVFYPSLQVINDPSLIHIPKIFFYISAVCSEISQSY